MRSSVPSLPNHPFELDPGSLMGIPWCFVYDEVGGQCSARPCDHQQAGGQPSGSEKGQPS